MFKSVNGCETMSMLCLILSQPKIYIPFFKDPSSKEDKAWVRGEGDHYLASVLYTFETDREEELSVMAGQSIRLAPKHTQPR